ncbi:hypothetical protein CAPTEDRAFT_155479 [Capitella teleta]|uniref:Noggin n=1 Tax=Capitella teleta TaxID=283909 RepID=R7UCW7_CAPTE|nr:hypothetical protein CAPTEDRAFT_155479 [Capitella teleta]|eukprot:ELU01643.1 hypothetical protein CAPTEDRAFT_155479 [Capitella teleta]
MQGIRIASVLFYFVLVDAASILPSSLRSTSSNHISNIPRKKHVTGSRPSPSDDLPILPLDYPEDERLLPSDADLDPYYLQQFMGLHYEPDFMSPVRPVDSIYNPNGTFEYDFRSSLPVSELPEGLRNLLFTLPGKNKKIKVKSKSTRRRIQRYLAAYTYCPVFYKWRDLGARFWPRWIKEGDCVASPHGRSCSVPAGMACKPQKSTAKTVLWWHCRRKSPCKWIFIQYPIITNCQCSC